MKMEWILSLFNPPKSEAKPAVNGSDTQTAKAAPLDTGSLTLGQKQRVFTRMVGHLIAFAYAQGYELTVGDAYRDPRVHGNVGQKKSYSSANSLHKERLAIDFNLFKDGVYLTRSEDYKVLADYWESIGGTSGIHFNDGNHFSMEHQGRK